MGRHSDGDGNGVADYAEANPYRDAAEMGYDPADPQAVAFHEPEPGALVDDGELTRMVATGELTVTTHEPVREPDEWHAEGWDAERDPDLPRDPD